MLFHLHLDGVVKELHARAIDLDALDKNLLNDFDFSLEVLGLIVKQIHQTMCCERLVGKDREVGLVSRSHVGELEN